MGNTCTITVKVTCGNRSCQLTSNDNIVWIPNEIFIVTGPVDVSITRSVKKPPFYKDEETQWSEYVINLNKDNLRVNLGISGKLAHADFDVNSTGQIYLVSCTITETLCHSE